MSYFYTKAHILTFYNRVFLSEVIFYTVITLLLRKKYAFHLHHYAICMTALTLLSYQHKGVIVLHGTLTGIMIEGGSRWGYAAVWEKKMDKTVSKVAELKQ